MAPILTVAGGKLPSPASAAGPQVGDITGVTLNQVGFTNLASFGLDGLTKARGQNGDVAILGNTAFVGGGSLFHGAQGSAGRICTDYGGVKVVDITTPASPTVVSTIDMVDIAGALQGATTSPRFGQKFDNVSVSAGAVDAMSINVPMGVTVGGNPFSGDVLAVAVQRCEQSFFAGARLEFWDVSNPLAPTQISTFNPPAQQWGIYEDVRMFTRVVGGIPKLYAVATTPFSIGNAHDAIGTGDMRILDLTNLSTPTQTGTFPSVQIGQSSINGCKTFLAGRAAAPTPDGNGAILSFYDGADSPTLTPNTPGQRPTVFNVDLNNVPTTPNDTTLFTPQPAHYDYANDPLDEINAADVAPFVATNTGPTNGDLLTVLSEDDIDPARTTFNIATPAVAAYTSGPSEACETFMGTDLHTIGGTTGTVGIVDVGRGCPASSLDGTLQRAADPYLADPIGKIAYVDSGGSFLDGCSATEKASRAAAAGAIALLTNGGAGPLNGTNNGPPGGIPPIPSISINTAAVNKIQMMPVNTLTGFGFPTTFTRTLTGGSVTTSAAVNTLGVVNLTAGSAIGATTLTVAAIGFNIPTGAVISVSNGVNATVTAPASTGATSISVSALSAAVASGNNGHVFVDLATATTLPVVATSVPIGNGAIITIGLNNYTVTAAAAVGATSLSVTQLRTNLGSSTVAQISLVTSATVDPGATTLPVVATSVPIPAGTQVLLGGSAVNVTAPAAAGSTSLAVEPVPVRITSGSTSLLSNATVQTLCVAHNVSTSSAATAGATTIAVRPTTMTLPAGTVLPFPNTNQVTVTAPAPAGSTSLTVAPIGANIAIDAQAIGGCLDSTPLSLYRTDVSRFRSVASSVDQVGLGELAAASRMNVVAGQAYKAGVTLEVQSHASGSFHGSVVWYDAGGAALSETPIGLLSGVAPRTPMETGMIAPALAVKAGMKFHWAGGASGVGFADSFQFSPDGLTGSAANTPGDGASNARWGAQRILNFSTTPPSLVGTYRSPNSLTWPPPDDGIYTPRITEMVGGDLAFSTWMSDGLRVLNLRDPANPVEVTSFTPAGVADPSPLSGSGNGDFRGQSWPNRRLLTGVDSKPTGPNSGILAVSDINAGLYILEYTVTRVPPPPVADFDGSGTTDVAIYRPSQGAWYVQGGLTTVWGNATDTPVPGDYDGDATTDVAVYRPSNGAWFVQGGITTVWGAPSDIPVPGDYDGNGTTDVAVYRPSNGAWFVQDGLTTVWGGAPGDIPVPGDYDGDGTTDIAIFRPSNGAWYVQGGLTTVWGAPDAVPVPGDYDGNGTTDVAVYRTTQDAWYVQGGLTTVWGAADAIPVPGDYDGNGTTDVAVYRSTQGAWYVQGGLTTVWGGLVGDVPLSAA